MDPEVRMPGLKSSHGRSMPMPGVPRPRGMAAGRNAPGLRAPKSKTGPTEWPTPMIPERDRVRRRDYRPAACLPSRMASSAPPTCMSNPRNPSSTRCSMSPAFAVIMSASPARVASASTA